MLLVTYVEGIFYTSANYFYSYIKLYQNLPFSNTQEVVEKAIENCDVGSMEQQSN